MTKAGLVWEPISRNLVRAAAAGEEATVAGRGLAAGESASRAAVPLIRWALAAGGGVASNTSSSSDSLQKRNRNYRVDDPVQDSVGPVLRIRIRDPVPFLPLDPGSGIRDG